MAGVKISALPLATLPLTGNELVPLVQSGVTRRATVNDAGGNAVNTKFTPAGTIAATNVQDAIVEAAAEATAAGTASGTEFTPEAGIAATNVQDAIVELAGDITSITDSTNIVVTPAGTITATDVQAALNQLDSLKVAKAGDTMTGALEGPYYAGDRVQVGRSATAANNFTFDATGASGVLWFYRGDAGFPIGGSIIQFNADDTVTFREALDGPLGGFDAVQWGRSGTATSNFHLTPTTAGAMKMARGNGGAGTQDIFTVDSSGDFAFIGEAQGPKFIADDLVVGRFVGPGAGNYTINADGTGALTIIDDLTFSLTLDGAGSILTSQLAVGGSSAPNAHSGLDLLGIKPMLLPRLTTAQRTAATGVEGMFCFDTDLNTVYQYTGSAWATFGMSGSQVTSFCMACSDETTALTTGTAKITFRMPYAMTLTAVRASLTTAQSAGSIFTVDINEGNVSILSTKLTIDNNERTSTTAVTAPVISDTALANDAEITVDIDQIGTSGATGLKVYLIGTI